MPIRPDIEGDILRLLRQSGLQSVEALKEIGSELDPRPLIPLLKELIQSQDPRPMAAQAATIPIEVEEHDPDRGSALAGALLDGIIESQAGEYGKMFNTDNPYEAAFRGATGTIPFAGPAIGRAADLASEGKYGRAAVQGVLGATDLAGAGLGARGVIRAARGVGPAIKAPGWLTKLEHDYDIERMAMHPRERKYKFGQYLEQDPELMELLERPNPINEEARKWLEGEKWIAPPTPTRRDIVEGRQRGFQQGSESPRIGQRDSRGRLIPVEGARYLDDDIGEIADVDTPAIVRKREAEVGVSGLMRDAVRTGRNPMRGPVDIPDVEAPVSRPPQRFVQFVKDVEGTEAEALDNWNKLSDEQRRIIARSAEESEPAFRAAAGQALVDLDVADPVILKDYYWDPSKRNESEYVKGKTAAMERAVNREVEELSGIPDVESPADAARRRIEERTRRQSTTMNMGVDPKDLADTAKDLVEIGKEKVRKVRRGTGDTPRERGTNPRAVQGTFNEGDQVSLKAGGTAEVVGTVGEGKVRVKTESGEEKIYLASTLTKVETPQTLKKLDKELTDTPIEVTDIEVDPIEPLTAEETIRRGPSPSATATVGGRTLPSSETKGPFGRPLKIEPELDIELVDDAARSAAHARILELNSRKRRTPLETAELRRLMTEYANDLPPTPPPPPITPGGGGVVPPTPPGDVPTPPRRMNPIVNASESIRSGKSILDIGAPFRQSRLASVNHPILAARNVGRSLRGVRNTNSFEDIMADIRSHPLYDEAVEAGVSFPHHGDVGGEFPTEPNWAHQIPGLRQVVAGSERAYDAFQSPMRMDLYELWKQQYPTATPEQIAKRVNLNTGYGELGPLEKDAELLSKFLWSPRWMSAKWGQWNQALNPWAKDLGPMQWAHRRDKAKALAAPVALAYGINALTGEDTEEDLRSPRFMRGQLSPDTSVGMWGGLHGMHRAAAQTLGQVGSELGIGPENNAVSMKGNEYKADIGDITTRFLRSQLAPGPGMLVDYISSEDYLGGPSRRTDPDTGRAGLRPDTDWLIRQLSPIAVENTMETFSDPEIGPVEAAATMPWSALGGDVLTMTDQETRRKERDAQVQAARRDRGRLGKKGKKVRLIQ